VIRTDDLLDRLDIVDVIGRYVELKRSGASHKARCPFHDERTPSFHVNPKRQTFKCFGCGKGGDAITFVRELLGLGFVDACERLCQDHGINLDGVRNVVTQKGRKAAKVAEAEVAGFSLYLKLRIEFLAQQQTDLRETYRVRQAMAEELEKLGTLGAVADDPMVETYRRSWFAQLELLEDVKAAGQRISAEIERLEGDPTSALEDFRKVFWVNLEARREIDALVKREGEAARERERSEAVAHDNPTPKLEDTQS
jgi:DNA primase